MEDDMTLHVRCECMWNAETKELTMRDQDCPVHTGKPRPLAGIYNQFGPHRPTPT